MPFPLIPLAGLGITAVASWWAGKKTAEAAIYKANNDALQAAAEVIKKPVYLPEQPKYLPTRCGSSAGRIVKEIGEETKNSSTINLPEETYQKIQENVEQINNRLDKREKLKLLEQIKTATPEEREAARKELLAQTRAEWEAANKVLKEQLEKQDKRNIELAKELQQAKEENDPSKIAKIMSMMKDNDKNQQATRLAVKKMMEEKSQQEKAINEYVQNVDKSVWSDLNFSSPLLWVILIAALAVSIATWWAIKWVFNKLKGTFTNE